MNIPENWPLEGEEKQTQPSNEPSYEQLKNLAAVALMRCERLERELAELEAQRERR